MSLWDQTKKQLRSVVEWRDPDPSQIFFRWSDTGDEIKNASKLLVGPGQGCLFVYEGKVQAVHTNPGLYELKTANIPFITTLLKFMQAFKSEHKVGLYFFRTAMIADLKWGTDQPIKYDDPKYKFPVALKAFGNFSFTIKNAESFFTGIVIKTSSVTSDSIRLLVVSRIMTLIKDFLAEQKFSYADIDANLVKISAGVVQLAGTEFDKLGFELNDFRIGGTSFDEKTMERINRIADARSEAMAAEALGLNYSQVQTLGAMRDAAKNQGGLAGVGVSMAAGLGLGQQMAQSMGQNMSGVANASAPVAADPASKLQKLKAMLDAGLITVDDFDKKKAEILASM
jgi:membrane protease subunit (stomatin/prohibitin family)